MVARTPRTRLHSRGQGRRQADRGCFWPHGAGHAADLAAAARAEPPGAIVGGGRHTRRGADRVVARSRAPGLGRCPLLCHGVSELEQHSIIRKNQYRISLVPVLLFLSIPANRFRDFASFALLQMKAP